MVTDDTTLSQCEIYFLNGESTKMNCQTINDIRCCLSHMRKSFLPAEIVLTSYPGGALLDDATLEAPPAVSALFCQEDATLNLYVNSLRMYAYAEDYVGIKRVVDEQMLRNSKFVSDAFLHACEQEYFEVVEALINNNVAVEEALTAVDEHGNTGLHLAARNDDFDIVEVLLNTKGVNVNAHRNDGWTPLHVAVDEARMTVCKLMLASKNVDVNASDSYGETALHYAADNGDDDIVDMILDRGDIEINQVNTFSATPLHLAALGGEHGVVERLLKEKNIDVNAQNKYGNTPLHLATWEGQKEVVESLLSVDSLSVNCKDNNDETALHFAADNGDMAIVEMLLTRKDLNINAQNSFGTTALHLAFLGNHTEIRDALLRRDDVLVDVKNKYGNSSLDLAKEEGVDDVVELMQTKVKGSWVQRVILDGVGSIWGS